MPITTTNSLPCKESVLTCYNRIVVRPWSADAIRLPPYRSRTAGSLWCGCH
jgi:hypothetical protein